MNALIRFFIFGTIFVLILATLNFYSGGFDVLRWSVLVSSLALIHITYRSRATGWIIVFGAIAIVFNPFYRFLHLTKDVWRWVDIFVIAAFSIFLWRYNDFYKKGLQFERYVSSLFPSNIWVIADRTKDSSKKLGRFVESDTNPDFTFRHITSGKTIAVECKYHSYLYKGKYGDFGTWWRKEQGKRYEGYGVENKIPVFVAIGIGGSAKNPQRLFFCPLAKLNNAAYEFIPEKDLKPFERKHGVPFSSDWGSNFL